MCPLMYLFGVIVMEAGRTTYNDGLLG